VAGCIVKFNNLIMNRLSFGLILLVCGIFCEASTDWNSPVVSEVSGVNQILNNPSRTLIDDEDYSRNRRDAEETSSDTNVPNATEDEGVVIPTTAVITSKATSTSTTTTTTTTTTEPTTAEKTTTTVTEKLVTEADVEESTTTQKPTTAPIVETTTVGNSTDISAALLFSGYVTWFQTIWNIEPLWVWVVSGSVVFVAVLIIIITIVCVVKCCKKEKYTGAAEYTDYDTGSLSGYGRIQLKQPRQSGKTPMSYEESEAQMAFQKQRTESTKSRADQKRKAQQARSIEEEFGTQEEHFALNPVPSPRRNYD